jgi:hypothetical protein
MHIESYEMSKLPYFNDGFTLRWIVYSNNKIKKQLRVNESFLFLLILLNTEIRRIFQQMLDKNKILLL